MRRLMVMLIAILALVGTTASCVQGGNGPGASAAPRY